MTDREDERKNFLRLLNAAQPAPRTPALPSEPQDAWPHSEITPAASSYPLPATDVRSAAAGEQHDRSGPTNIAGSPAYLSHHPAPSVATPGGLAGANLLRMIQQGPPQSPAETSTLQQRQPHQQQQQHHQQQGQLQPPQRYLQQQQHQQYSASPSPISAQRSVAEQQERFLKRFLDITDSSSSSRHNHGAGSRASSSPPPINSSPAYPPAAGPPPPPPPPLSSAVESGLPGHKRLNSKARGQEKGKGRNQRGGRGRGGVGHENSNNNGGGGSGYEPDSPSQGGERKRSATPGRGHTGKQGRGGQPHGATAVRETRKGKNKGGGARGGGGGAGRGGGGGGGRAPATSPAYAWSSFQNSPDPKSIPIPSLKNLGLHGEASPRERTPGAAPPSLNLREEGADESRWAVDDAGSAGMHTPPPPPERAAARAGMESRSTAKKAEDDIKRMLWGDGWLLNDDP